MTESPPVTDLAFALRGQFVPSGYAERLWQSVSAALPWLAEEPAAGLLPLRGTEQSGGLWLPRRSRLVLRLPMARADEARALEGVTLDLGSGTLLEVGAAEERPHHGYPTLHAALVATELEEVAFGEQVRRELDDMGVEGQWICGRERMLRCDNVALRGFSLVVHHLKGEQSLRLQARGLGQARHLGCGIFVPYKAIPNLE
ncbi:MAG: type I-MYXAN CRISPR-associated protein Cas6/Cmx6 [Betaproteobacteria bacterium]|nr:type I-MYXAN CRISPR-associated protein Cas6/Cmx6 [Betaproteobacteria bacterium]MDE2131593.1 type I-MYXAN CRISPR-associated protein Cas6/Cmx6 [Betaproteobacteria bacterium]MDE2211697.1 type I-MYXAN CRISPR-associated protein Cas6/Cmx6 [Betaproteobacteria bacterium]MDE2354413.1 type I-MYXAN CRISPR-associated protein Cas6/Cmx6 [Betaproteobacteria bacterium]